MPTEWVSVPVEAPTTMIGPSDVGLRVGLDLVLAHVLRHLTSLGGEGGVVHSVLAGAVHHEVGVTVGEALVVDHLGVLQAHLAGELQRGLARGLSVGYGQGEGELHEPVAVVVGVGPDVGQVVLLRQRRAPPA